MNHVEFIKMEMTILIVAIAFIKIDDCISENFYIPGLNSLISVCSIVLLEKELAP